jgi:hypothetical protein
VVAGCVQALMAWYFLRKDFGKRVDQVPSMPAADMGTAS